MHLGYGPKGQFLTKQKRPAAVACFLNKIPLDDRHAATNALLLLGLRAYEQAVADAPADVHTLRAVVAMELTNIDSDNSTHAQGIMRAAKVSGKKEALTLTHTPASVQDSSNKIGVSLSGKDITSLRHSSSNSKTDKNMLSRGGSTVRDGEGCSSSGGGGVDCPTPILLHKANALLDRIDRTPENKNNTSAGSLLPLACSGRSSSRDSMEKRQLRAQTPALSFILRDVLEGAVEQSVAASSSTGVATKFPNGAHTATHGDDQSTNHDLSVYDVSDGTPEEQGNAVDHHDNGMYNESTLIPLNSSDEEYYPIDFLRCLKSHIESTNGVRENPLLVAASIPQYLSIYTLRSGFDNLYRSLLVSYHLSNETSKGDRHDIGN
ncbi:uncharacterized protein TM35_000081980 [Trypanosoma theileri]|uniref:Uncharacterized protein n=1 Tax=Trypanosoma theileri TaxID=67003 RepID=A0A1X0P1W5_9TRYP|nr:uncharacterized protein TM35_000081980 [Trypanosoma theileri]ORC90400.1 hypothetical protein TM35_000081980 [Trypanosoma theileri]